MLRTQKDVVLCLIDTLSLWAMIIRFVRGRSIVSQRKLSAQRRVELAIYLSTSQADNEYSMTYPEYRFENVPKHISVTMFAIPRWGGNNSA